MTNQLNNIKVEAVKNIDHIELPQTHHSTLLKVLLISETEKSLSAVLHGRKKTAGSSKTLTESLNNKHGLGSSKKSGGDSGLNIDKWFANELSKFANGPLSGEAVIQFLEAIFAMLKSKNLSAADKAELKKILGNFIGKGKSINAANLVQAVMYYYMMNNGKSYSDFEKAMAKFEEEIDKALEQNPDIKFLQELKEQIDGVMKHLKGWYDKNKSKDMDTLMLQMLMRMFLNNPSLEALEKKIKKGYIDKILSKYKNNMYIVAALLLGPIGLELNTDIFKLSGEGFTSKLIGKLEKDISNISDEFTKAQSKDGFTGDELKKMMTNIKNLEVKVKMLEKLYGPAIAEQIGSTFGPLLNTTIKIDGKDVSFQTLLGEKDVNWDQIAKDVKDQHIFYTKGSKTDPAGPSELTTSTVSQIKAAITTTSNQQQSISVEMSRMSQTIQTFENFIKTTLVTDWSKSWIGQLVKNQVVYS